MRGKAMYVCQKCYHPMCVTKGTRAPDKCERCGCVGKMKKRSDPTRKEV